MSFFAGYRGVKYQFLTLSTLSCSPVNIFYHSLNNRDLSTSRAKSLHLVGRNNFNRPTLNINYEKDIASEEKTTMTTLLSERIKNAK
jgi:hypothetical protein